MRDVVLRPLVAQAVQLEACPAHAQPRRRQACEVLIVYVDGAPVARCDVDVLADGVVKLGARLNDLRPLVRMAVILHGVQE